MQFTKIDISNILVFLKNGEWKMSAEQSLGLVDTIMRMEQLLQSLEKAEAEKAEADKKPAEAKKKVEKKVEKKPTPTPAPEKKPEAKTK